MSTHKHSQREIEKLLFHDCKKAEKLICRFLKIPQPKNGFKICYDPKNKLRGFHVSGTITFNNEHYKQGYFQKHHVVGKGMATILGKSRFPGNIKYLHDTLHETVHCVVHYSRRCRSLWDQYFQEGFAEWISFSILLTLGKKFNDPEYERLVASYVTVYIVAYNFLNKTDRTLSDFLIDFCFSQKTILKIKKQINAFLLLKHRTNNVISFLKEAEPYAFGLLRIFEWKAKLPKLEQNNFAKELLYYGFRDTENFEGYRARM